MDLVEKHALETKTRDKPVPSASDWRAVLKAMWLEPTLFRCWREVRTPFVSVGCNPKCAQRLQGSFQHDFMSYTASRPAELVLCRDYGDKSSALLWSVCALTLRYDGRANMSAGHRIRRCRVGLGDRQGFLTTFVLASEYFDTAFDTAYSE